MNFVKNAAAGAVLGGSLLFTAGLGMATAQPVEAPAPDGLVNLSVGDVTLLESVTADTAATAASALCGAVPADVTALVTQVDGEGAQQTVCSGLPGGDLVVAQNASVSTEGVPAAPAEAPAPAEEPAPEGDAGSAEGETGGGEGLGAPEGTGDADGGTVPLPSEEG